MGRIIIKDIKKNFHHAIGTKLLTYVVAHDDTFHVLRHLDIDNTIRIVEDEKY